MEPPLPNAKRQLRQRNLQENWLRQFYLPQQRHQVRALNKLLPSHSMLILSSCFSLRFKFKNLRIAIFVYPQWKILSVDIVPATVADYKAQSCKQTQPFHRIVKRKNGDYQ